MKKTRDYDNVFKTLKMKHKRLFISVINDVFGRDYPSDVPVEILPSEGFLAEDGTSAGDADVRERITDFLVVVRGEAYLLECQSYDDDSIAIRIAEYAFISAEKRAVWSNGKAEIPMPHFAVIYIKSTGRTPARTEITFIFPDGTRVLYGADNVFLEDFTKEYIVEKRLFPYIPFYIARYEKDISGDGDISQAVSDLEYFRDRMLELYEQEELTYAELIDLMKLVNTIVTHITDGNRSEERMVEVMGGVVLKTASEELVEQGIAIGEARGEEFNMISMVCKKIRRGKDISEITDDLEEEDPLRIRMIYSAAMKCAPEFDTERIYQVLTEAREK